METWIFNPAQQYVKVAAGLRIPATRDDPYRSQGRKSSDGVSEAPGSGQVELNMRRLLEDAVCRYQPRCQLWSGPPNKSGWYGWNCKWRPSGAGTTHSAARRTCAGRICGPSSQTQQRQWKSSPRLWKRLQRKPRRGWRSCRLRRRRSLSEEGHDLILLQFLLILLQ